MTAAAAAAGNPTAALLCRFLLDTGLRISEAAAVHWGDFFQTPHGDVALRVVGKGDKARSIKVRASLWTAIQECRARQGLAAGLGADDAPLFPNRRGGPGSTRYLYRLVKLAVEQAGIGKPASPHWFRHTHATLALAGGASLVQVQRDLGDASLHTTQKYLHLVRGLREGSADFLPDFSDGPSGTK